MTTEENEDRAWPVKENYSVLNSLMRGYKHERDGAQAELELIRERVNELFEGPWMPNRDYVISALYPSPARIRDRVEEKERKNA